MTEHENNTSDNKYRNLSEFIKTVGFPIAVVCYFLVKDWYYTDRLLDALTRIVIALDRIGVAVK